MCGRLTLTEYEEIAQALNEMDYMDHLPMYNAAPTERIPVTSSKDPDQLSLYRWGLVPVWADNPAIGNKMINARSETLHEKSFKRLLKRNRCLVWTDGFYEWKKVGPAKQPYRIQLKDRKCFTMGGLWDSWKDPTGKTIDTFTIITTLPNEMMSGIHDRMPVIIPKQMREKWLTGEAEYNDLIPFFDPYPTEQMLAYPVSADVGKATNKAAYLIEPLVA